MFNSNCGFYGGKILLDEYFYVAINGVIRKYNRVWNGKYLSSEYRGFGNENQRKITKFAKKDNVIFFYYDNEDVESEDERYEEYFRYIIQDLNLFPKHNIMLSSIQIWNIKRNRTFILVGNISQGSRCLKIDPSGEKLNIESGDFVSLYNFDTNDKENLHRLGGVRDLLWKDNQIFFSGHDDGSLRHFDLRIKSVSY